jgi:MFS family permease
MHPGFRRLLLGRTSSFLATAVVPTALTLTVIKITRDADALGLVLAAELIPQLFLLPVGGVLADRLPPKWVSFAADSVRGLAQLAIALELLLHTADLTNLVVLSGITGAAIAFGTPTMSPLVTAIAPEEETRLRANSQLGTARGLALVAGPSIAGVLVVAVGAGWCFVVTGVLFFIGAVAVCGLRVKPAASFHPQASFLRSLADGWQEVRARPWFWSNLVGHAVSNLAAGVLMTLGPLIAVRQLGGEVSWVVIYQPGMAGLVLGALVAPRLRVTRPLVLTSVCGALFALPLLTFAVPMATWAEAIAYGVAMLGVGVLNTIWVNTMQRQFPPNALARADSYDSLLSFAARPFGLAIAAPLAAVTGMAAPLLVTAGLVLVANLGIIALPDVRKMTVPRKTALPDPAQAAT